MLNVENTHGSVVKTNGKFVSRMRETKLVDFTSGVNRVEDDPGPGPIRWPPLPVGAIGTALEGR